MTNPVNTETPDPIAMFTEAEDNFDEARIQLISLLGNQISLRDESLNLKREMQELEADVMLGGVEGGNAEQRKAALVQAMAADPRVEGLRKRQAQVTAAEETTSVDIEHERLCLSSARARRSFALVLLQHQTAAQGDRWATIQGGLATIQEAVAVINGGGEA